MNRHFYAGVGETVFSERLPSGLELRVVPKPGFAKKHAFLAVNYGGADIRSVQDGTERTVPEGTAHFLEHKMFDMPEGNALQTLSMLGANPNAFTSSDLTAYFFETTVHFEECLRLLVRFVLTPCFSPESVEKEQGIIAQEIRMIEDDPGRRVHVDLLESLYAEHPVRTSIAGSVESIAEITAGTLEQCHRDFYRPENMVLFVVGDVDPEQVAALAEASVPAEKREAEGPMPELLYGQESGHVLRDRALRQMTVGQPLFMGGWKGESMLTGASALREEITADLALSCLMGRSSKLFADLYAEGLVNDSFEGTWEKCRGTASLLFGGESREPERVTERVHAAAEAMARDGVEDAFFRRVRRACAGQLIRGFDSFPFICYAGAKSFFQGEDFFTCADIAREITGADVAAFLARHTPKEGFALSVVEPKEGQYEC